MRPSKAGWFWIVYAIVMLLVLLLQHLTTN